LQTACDDRAFAQIFDDERIEFHTHDKEQQRNTYLGKCFDGDILIYDMRQKYAQKHTGYDISDDHRLFEEFHDPHGDEDHSDDYS